MKVIIKGRWETRIFETKANNLENALAEILDKVMEEDDPGFFFETEDADMDYWKTQTNFHVVRNEYGEFGCIVVE